VTVYFQWEFCLIICICWIRWKDAAHFYLDDAQALSIYKQLQRITSGYLVPKLAREIGGEPNKTLYTA